MIEFHCNNCGRKLSVQDQHSGKRVKCPKCGSVGVVPDKSDKIKFHCENCGQSVSVPRIHAGKKGKCPKCKNVIVVPNLETAPVKNTSMVSFTCSMCNETVQVPKTSIGKTIECPECGSFIESSPGAAPGKSHTSADADLYEEETEEYEESEGVDRRIIIGVSAVAAVVVVGLIILVAVFRSSKPRPTERPEDLRTQQRVADTDSRPEPAISNPQPAEPVKEDTLTEKTDLQETSKQDISLTASVSLERKLEDTLIAFRSDRDGVTKIYGVRPDGSGLRDLTNNPHGGEIWPSWSPDGKALVFACIVHTKDARGISRSKSDIFITNVDSTGRRNLTNNPVHDQYPLWSPDGSMIAYLSDIENNLTFHLHVVKADGSGVRNLTNAPTRYPSWSPDGKKLACFVEREGKGAIYIMNADGSEEKRLDKTTTRGIGSGSYITGEGRSCWSPDGTMITFISKRDIYVAGADGSGWKRLVDNSTQEVCVSWSPDGRRIAFISYGGRERKLHVMNSDGSEQQMLAEYLLNDSLTWSPDGRKIAFASNRDGNNEIYVINVDGSGLQNLTNSPADEDSPAWSPFLPSELELMEEPGSEEEPHAVEGADVRTQIKAESKEFESHQAGSEQVPSLPQTSVDYFNRGKAYDHKCLYDQAISDFEKSIEMDPMYAEAYLYRGLSYHRKGEHEQAILDFDKVIEIENKAIEMDPMNAKAYCNRGTALSGKGEYDQAILDLNKAIHTNPEYAEAHLSRGAAYNNKGEFDRAILDYTKAIGINPRFNKAYVNRGIAYNNKGESHKAISDYNKALEINPGEVTAYNNRGATYDYIGKHDLAISDYSKSIEINPRDAAAYVNRGGVYHSIGAYDQAITDYNKAIEIDPRYARAYYNRGYTYCGKGEYNPGISDFNKAIEIDPGLAVAYYNRATAYFLKGDYDKAWEDVHKSQSLGHQVHPGFLNALSKASGRRR